MKEESKPIIKKRNKSFINNIIPCTCGGVMEVVDSGKLKGQEWLLYKCKKCGLTYNEEPEF